MVWLRNTEMGNLAGKENASEATAVQDNGTNGGHVNGGGETNGGHQNGDEGGTDETCHNFSDDVHDISSESIHVDDEITITIRHDSPVKSAKHPKSLKSEVKSYSNGSLTKSPSKVPNGDINVKSSEQSPKNPAVEDEAPTAGGCSGSAVRALFFDDFVENKTDKITSSPKDRHLKPERWKFKTRKKRKKEEKEQDGDRGNMPKNSVQSNYETSTGT